MGKISNALLSSLFVSRSAAETYAITGCNNDSVSVSQIIFKQGKFGQGGFHKQECLTKCRFAGASDQNKIRFGG